MKFETFENLVTQLYNNKLERDCQFNKFPINYKIMIFDDEYVESVLEENHLLMQHIFGDNYLCVRWFLYDWKPGYTLVDNGIECVIQSIEDYLKYKEDNWDV
jgi:hypothetical protein